MISSKYLLADLIQFVIARLADERDEQNQNVVKLLLRAKDELLSTPALQQETEQDDVVACTVEEFNNPSKNPLIKDLQDTLENYEKTIHMNNDFQQQFQKVADDVEQEEILQSLKQP